MSDLPAKVKISGSAILMFLVVMASMNGAGVVVRYENADLKVATDGDDSMPPRT